uniref:Predicted protein n=1 Tax=Hordeum vulgare subsp. vulgare TaxID=112509 RepID=F2E3H4_HORVV|nr:predicted protein [Hordeum vulgare subsp. vulgare]
MSRRFPKAGSMKRAKQAGPLRPSLMPPCAKHRLLDAMNGIYRIFRIPVHTGQSC